MDPQSVERGLAGRVLTVVEPLRRLMERQALRRIDEGGLSDEQVENLGLTLMALEKPVIELREHFGLSRRTSTLTLGRLGRCCRAMSGDHAVRNALPCRGRFAGGRGGNPAGDRFSGS